MLVTPVQLASAMAALARKGVRYRPHLVGSITTSDNASDRKTKPEIIGQYAIKRDLNWQHIHHSMVDVVHHAQGTAQTISAGLNYRIAGKTGTAQVFSIAQDDEYDEETVSQNLRDHALFIGYAPADDPRIAVAVIVENGGHGSSVAAPVARRVMDAYFGDTL